MATQIGIGFSQEIETEISAKKAAIQVLEQLNHSEINLVIIFHSTHYDPKILTPIISKILKCKILIGCSTAGIILNENIKTRGISVLAICSSQISFGHSCVEDIHYHSPEETGQTIARSALQNMEGSQRQIFLMLFDGLIQNNAQILAGVQSVLGNIFPIIGAGVSDNFEFKSNTQIYNGKILQNSIIGLIIGGQTTANVSARHGWKALGKPRIITEAEGNIIKVIDGKKAVSIYEEFLGEHVNRLKSSVMGQISLLYPLGVYISDSEKYLLRNVIKITPEGHLVCQGEVKQGLSVHIMIGNKKSCMQAALDAAHDVYLKLGNKKAKLVLIFESMARLKLLGREAHKEIQGIQDIFGKEVPIVGMYSNGEVFPYQVSENFAKPHHQNESIVILAIT